VEIESIGYRFIAQLQVELKIILLCCWVILHFIKVILMY